MRGSHSMPKTVVIVGAGVAGLSTAFHLAEKEVERVVLLDKGGVGDGSSIRSGAVNTMLMSTETATRARAKSMDIFERFSRILKDYTFYQVGCLGLYSSKQYSVVEPQHEMHRRAGGKFEVLRRPALEARFPDLRIKDDEYGILDLRGGYNEPHRYIPALMAKVGEMGVEIREHEALADFIIEGDRVKGVHTQKSGDLRADAVVCTVNAWANHVLFRYGQKLPIKNFVHERFVTKPFDRLPRLPATNDNATGTYVRPTEDNRLLMGTSVCNPDEFNIPHPDFDFTDLEPAPEALPFLREAMIERIPMLAGAEFDYHRVGLISLAADSHPVIGPVDALPGLYLGTNFHSGGFGYGPVAGFLLAEFIVDGQTSIDVTEFSPDRFKDFDTEAYLAHPVKHHDMGAAYASKVYQMKPIVRRH